MRLTVYQDVTLGWRWRIVADNGRIVADSGEAYVSRSNAIRAARALIAADLTLDDRNEVNAVYAHAGAATATTEASGA